MHTKFINVWIGARTMSAKRDDTFNTVIAFIVEEIPWANKKNLNEQTDIVNDLGLYGDDCLEFLEKFCKKFNLDCTKLDLSKCGQEGVDPLTGVLLWIFSILKQRKTKQKNGYKISELMKFIENEGV